MRIAVGGASGLIGSRLVQALENRGDEVVRLVRRPARADNERQWDPDSREIFGPGLRDVDAVINLAGAPIGGARWSRKYRREILDSRVASTQTVVRALREAHHEGANRCQTFLSASAMGYYGFNAGDRILVEDSPSGTGFLAGVCRAWEREAVVAEDLGVRVVRMRTANVLSESGGFLGALRPLFQWGVAGRIGSGEQWLSWVHIDDHVAAQLWLLDGETRGAVNIAAPFPVRNRDFTRDYAWVLRRPAFIPFPRRLVALVLTPTMVKETVAAGQREVPEVLQSRGFTFKHPSVVGALQDIEAKRRGRKR